MSDEGTTATGQSIIVLVDEYSAAFTNHTTEPALTVSEMTDELMAIGRKYDITFDRDRVAEIVTQYGAANIFTPPHAGDQPR